MKYARVRDAVKSYESGLDGVKEYFNQPDLKIEPASWCSMLKKMLDEGYNITAEIEISSVSKKLNLLKHV